MAIAFFDLDLTLLSVNSAVLWVQSERRLGHISNWQALRAATWLARYKLGFSSLDGAVREAIGTLRGKLEKEIRARSEDFYQREVRRAFRPGGLLAIAERKRRGDRCVLLTSSSNYVAEQAAKDLGLDGIVCNRFEVDESGVYTGASVGPLCFGEGKLLAATEHVASTGVKLSECAFFTDSYSDLPMLLAVCEPIAVHPDVRLRRVARRRGWQVLDWAESLTASGEQSLASP